MPSKTVKGCVGSVFIYLSQEAGYCALHSDEVGEVGPLGLQAEEGGCDHLIISAEVSEVPCRTLDFIGTILSEWMRHLFSTYGGLEPQSCEGDSESARLQEEQ